MEAICPFVNKVAQNCKRFAVQGIRDPMNSIRRNTYCMKGGNHDTREKVSLLSPYESIPPTDSAGFFL